MSALEASKARLNKKGVFWLIPFGLQLYSPQKGKRERERRSNTDLFEFKWNHEQRGSPESKGKDGKGGEWEKSRCQQRKVRMFHSCFVSLLVNKKDVQGRRISFSSLTNFKARLEKGGGGYNKSVTHTKKEAKLRSIGRDVWEYSPRNNMGGNERRGEEGEQGTNKRCLLRLENCTTTQDKTWKQAKQKKASKSVKKKARQNWHHWHQEQKGEKKGKREREEQKKGVY